MSADELAALPLNILVAMFRGAIAEYDPEGDERHTLDEMMLATGE